MELSPMELRDSPRNKIAEYSYHSYEHDALRHGVAADPEGRIKRRFLRLRSLFQNCCWPLPKVSKHKLKRGFHDKATRSPIDASHPTFEYDGAHSWAIACGLQEEGGTSHKHGSSHVEIRLHRQRHAKNSKEKKEYDLSQGQQDLQRDYQQLLRAYEEEVEFDCDYWGESDVHFHTENINIDANKSSCVSFPRDDSNLDESDHSDAWIEAGLLEGPDIFSNPPVNFISNVDQEGGWIDFDSKSFSPKKHLNRMSKPIPSPSPKSPLTYGSGRPGYGTPVTATDNSTTWDDDDGSIGVSDSDIKSNPKTFSTKEIAQDNVMISRKIADLVLPSFEEEDSDKEIDEKDEDIVDSHVNESNDSGSISVCDKGSKSSSDIDGYSYSINSFSTFRPGKSVSEVLSSASKNIDPPENLIEEPPKTIRSDVNDLFQLKAAGDNVDNNIPLEDIDVNTNSGNDSQTGLSNYMSIFYPEDFYGIDHDKRSDTVENAIDDISGSSGEDYTKADDFSLLYNASMASV